MVDNGKFRLKSLWKTLRKSRKKDPAVISKVRDAAAAQKKRSKPRQASIANTVASADDQSLALSMHSVRSFDQDSTREMYPANRNLTIPQDFLDNMLEEQGYSTQTWKTLRTGYFNEASTLPIASYHIYLTKLV